MTSEVGCAMGRENNAKKKGLTSKHDQAFWQHAPQNPAGVGWNATSEQYLRTISIDRYFVNPVH